MTLETDIFTALKSLVANRVYRDLAPQGVTDLPRITFQQVGGTATNFLDPTAPSRKNARVQVNVWGADRDSVAALARTVEDTLRTSAGLCTYVLNQPVAVYEPETELYGSRQDFSFWHVS